MSEPHHPHQALKLYLQSVNTITCWMNNYPKTSAHIFIYTRLPVIQRLQRKTQHLSGVQVSFCWWVLFSPFDMVSQQKVWRYSGQCLLMNTIQMLNVKVSVKTDWHTYGRQYRKADSSPRKEVFSRLKCVQHTKPCNNMCTQTQFTVHSLQRNMIYTWVCISQFEQCTVQYPVAGMVCRRRNVPVQLEWVSTA